jgi:hypothetical protein
MTAFVVLGSRARVSTIVASGSWADYEPVPTGAHRMRRNDAFGWRSLRLRFGSEAAAPDDIRASGCRCSLVGRGRREIASSDAFRSPPRDDGRSIRITASRVEASFVSTVGGGAPFDSAQGADLSGARGFGWPRSLCRVRDRAMPFDRQARTRRRVIQIPGHVHCIIVITDVGAIHESPLHDSYRQELPNDQSPTTTSTDNASAVSGSGYVLHLPGPWVDSKPTPTGVRIARRSMAWLGSLRLQARS